MAMAQEERQPLAADGPNGHWHDDLSEVWKDDTICCASVCLPCWRWSNTMSRAGILSFRVALVLHSLVYLVPLVALVLVGVLASEAAKNGTLSFPAIILSIVFWASILAGLYLCTWGRGQLRRRYNIPGDRGSDCWAHSRSHYSALAQEARHVEASEQRAAALPA